MNNVFNGYQNLMNGTLNVVVHEWVPILKTSLENSSFKIVDSFIMWHNHYLETLLYVFIICLTFQQTINNMQR
jgi:hypothetical protein